MATKYRVKAAYLAAYPNSTTLVEGVAVALSGKDITVTKPGTATHPPSSRTIKGATQAQLKYLFETERNPHIEMLDEKE